MIQFPTWSFSTYGTFTECRRKYYYDKYYDLCDDKGHVIMLKRMTSLPMLSGSIVHGILAKAIAERFGYDRIPDSAVMEQVFREKFRDAVNKSLAVSDSSSYSWSSEAMLEEHYYKDPDIKNKIKEAEDKCAGSIACLTSTKLWHTLMNEMTADNIKYVEKEGEFPCFYLDKIKIYSIIDLAVSSGDGENGWCRIFDWKTGKPGSANPVQLAVYGMYAKQTWGWNPEKVKFEFVHMYPFVERVKAQTTGEDIRRTEELIRSSFGEMLILYNNGEPDMDSFPMCDSGRCRYCRYRELCKKE